MDASNSFADAVGAPDAPAADVSAEGVTANPFAAIAQGEAANLRQASQGALYRAQGTNPDQYARANAIAGQVGLHPDTVAADLPTFERQQELARQASQAHSSAALESFLTDGIRAKLARDDLGPLAAIADIGAAARAGYLESFTPPRSGAEYHPSGAAAHLANMAGSVAGFLAEAYSSNEAAAGLALGTGAGLMTGPGAPVAGPALGFAGWTAGAASHVVSRTFGESLERTADIRDDNGQPMNYAARVGIASVNSVIEGAMVGVGGGIATSAAKGVEAALFAAAERPTMAAALAGYGAGILKSAGHAGMIGGGLDAVQQTSDQVARALSNSIDQTQFQTWASNPETIPAALEHVVGEALKWATFGGILHGAVGTVGLGADLLRVRDSERMQGQITGLLDTATTSKLRERSPQDFREFMQQQVGGGPVENIEIPASRLMDLYQGMHVDPFALEADPIFGFDPDFKAKLREGLDTGGLVKIGTADYATHLAGSDIDSRLREDIAPEGGHSIRSAKEANTAIAAAMQRQMEQLNAELASEHGAQSPREMVYREMYSRLRAEGGMGVTEADHNARVVAAHYAARAEVWNAAKGGDHTDAWAQYQRQDVALQRTRDQAPGLKTYDIGNTDALINDIRAGKTATTRDLYGPGLTEWLANHGGLEFDRGDELKSLDLDKWHLGKTAMPRLVRTGGRSLEDAAMSAADNGFMPDDIKAAMDAGDPVDREKALLDALGRDQVGHGVRSADLADHDAAARHEAMDQIRRVIDDEGIDIKTADNETVKVALDKWRQKASGGTEHHQPDGSASNPKGSIQIMSQRGERLRAVINLFHGADRSTFLHESAHLWLEELIRDAADPTAPDAFRADFAKTMAFLGVERPEQIEGAQHEQFARGFEAYMMEGKAPSVALEGAFGRLKSWLLSIYRSIGGLDAAAGHDVRIDPDIRAVFDRMLASEDEIKLARDRQGLRQLFKTPEEMGATPELFDAYLKAVDDAKTAAVTDVERRAIAALARERLQAWREEEGKLREEIAPAIDARGDIQALKAYRSGRLPDGREGAVPKMDRSAIVHMFGSEGILKELKLAFGSVYIAKGGVHPDMVAEMFGYRDGREFLQAMMGLKRQERDARDQTGRPGLSIRDHIIDIQAHATMIERHGDIMHDGTLADEALDAVHSDKQAEVLAAEIQALRSRGQTVTHKGQRVLLGPVKPHEIAKARAEAMVAAKRVRDVTALAPYARAEAKAARTAEDALLKGDYPAAGRAKEQQLMAHALWRAVKNAGEQVEKDQAILGKFAKKATIKGLAQDALDQIHTLLERFDFSPASAKEVVRRGSLAEWITRQEAANGPDSVAISDKLRNEAFRQHFTEMTVADMRDLADAARNIAHLGRLKQTLLDNQAARDFADWKAEAFAHLDNLPRREAPREMVIGSRSDIKGRLEAAGMALRRGTYELLKAETIIDWLDNRDPNGPFNRVLFRPIKDALFKSFDRQKLVVDHFRDIEKAMPKGWDKSLDDWIDLPMRNADGKAFRGEKRHVLGLALNWGNDSNRTKLLDGYGGAKNGWTRETVQGVLDRHMTEADWHFVQSVWDSFAGLKPDIWAMQKRVTGVGPDDIKATPITTPWGEKAGGYFPVIYDPKRSERAAGNLDRDAAALYDRNSYGAATTSKGHTVSRAEGYSAPIDFRSLELLPHRIGQQIHDLYFREAVNQANKVLGDKDVAAAIGERLGDDAIKQLRGWVQAVANDRNLDAANYTFVERLLKAARANTVAVGIAFRIGTILKHDLSALSMSFDAVGPRPFLGAAMDLFADLGRGGALMKEIMEKSGEIRHRMNSYDRDTQGQMEKMAQYAGPGSVRGIGRMAVNFRDEMNHLGHLPVSYLDFLSTLPVWLATHRKGIADGMSDADAVFAADKMVRKAHGAQTIVDQAAIQRGSETRKLMTMFYGFFNRTFNGGADAVMRTQSGMRALKDGDTGIARGEFLKVMSFAVGSLMVPAMVEAMVAGHAPRQDESWFGWAGKAILGQVAATVPFVRDLASAAMHGRDYEFSPVVAAVNNVIHFAAKDVPAMFDDDKAMTGGELKRAMTAGGLVTGVGTGQLATSAQYVWDVLHDRQNPQDAGEFLRALAFGPPKKH